MKVNDMICCRPFVTRQVCMAGSISLSGQKRTGSGQESEAKACKFWSCQASFFYFSGFKHIFWSIIVCVAMGCAAIFLYSNTIDFMNATVVTTVDTMTVPLSEVFFPSVVVCNINQVRINLPLFLVCNKKYTGILTVMTHY